MVGSNQAVVTATGPSLPTMKQYFTLDQTDSFLVRVEADGANLSANWMGPGRGGFHRLGRILASPTTIALWSFLLITTVSSVTTQPINSSATGYEVGAFYDNTSRNGLVVGSVTHDIWKTGVYFSGANNSLTSMNVFGGATSPWECCRMVLCPETRFLRPRFLSVSAATGGSTMQNYAAENTNYTPRLPWTNGVPFGWNSWGVIQQNINYTDAIAVSDFFHTNLQVGRISQNSGTVYINLDSYWNNLTSFQLQSFVNHCHADGQKAGIYFGPFVWFGRRPMRQTPTSRGHATLIFTAISCCAMAAAIFESVDGGLAVDPTHPGTQGSINYYSIEYHQLGV